MFIRLLVIWIGCGLWLYSIHNSEPKSTPAQVALTPEEQQTVMAHLRCVAPVIEGRNLRALNSANVPVGRDYVSAPLRADGAVTGHCGPIQLATASR